MKSLSFKNSVTVRGGIQDTDAITKFMAAQKVIDSNIGAVSAEVSRIERMFEHLIAKYLEVPVGDKMDLLYDDIIRSSSMTINQKKTVVVFPR